MKNNRLAEEKSPYLRQHAQNPVDWYPWGEAAFIKAREENKLVFLSIGYSTCYWCHMMEKDSFEREDVARALNQDFVAIKVDREEHPEVDEIYMDAVIAMTGHGGWPMSVFLTPELKPFWGGTFVPRLQFLRLLEQVAVLWSQDPQRILQGGEKLLALLQEKDFGGAEKYSGKEIVAQRFLQQSTGRFDSQYGGFGSAPKFPPSMALRWLMRIPNEQAMPMVEKTLDSMALGGIYDQLAGGFHRYSTDEKWLVPHFEKMLYDNALLAIAYTEAFKKNKKIFYASVAQETLKYLLRDMRSPEGVFYAAEDAGEVDQEGDFYVWSKAELESALGEQSLSLFSVFPFAEKGNFEKDKNILCFQTVEDWTAFHEGGLSHLQKRLFSMRNTRIRPHRDEKILTAWNGLVIRAFALAGAAFSEDSFLQAAITAAQWIKQNLWDGTQLLRRYCDGEAKYRANAADYAFLIDGLIELYQSTFSEEWLLWAKVLQEKMDQECWDSEQGGYFTASQEEPNLIIRKKDIADGAIPSANSVAYRNLQRLSRYFLFPDWEEKSARLMAYLAPSFDRIPYGSAELGVSQACEWKEVVLVGNKQDCLTIAGQLRNNFSLLLVGESHASAIPLSCGKQHVSEESTTAYICENNSCLPPCGGKEAVQRLQS